MDRGYGNDAEEGGTWSGEQLKVGRGMEWSDGDGDGEEMCSAQRESMRGLKELRSQ